MLHRIFEINKIATKSKAFLSSVADPDNFAPDPDSKFLFLSELIKDFYLKIILYKNRILPYHIFLNKKKNFLSGNLGMIF